MSDVTAFRNRLRHPAASLFPAALLAIAAGFPSCYAPAVRKAARVQI